MKNDFINLFKAVEPIEQTGYRQYIQFFYGQQKVVLNVFEQLDQSIGTQEEERFMASISKNKNSQNALSDLKKWLFEFLTIQEIKSNTYDAQLLTLEALRKRRLKGAFLDKSKQLRKDLTTHPSPDMWVMYRKLRLAHIHYFDTEIDPLLDFQAELHHIMDVLDSFYISAKLKYTAELHSRSYILQENYHPRLVEGILTLIETDDALDAAIKNFYLPLHNLAKDKTETNYLALKTFLTENQSHERIEKFSVLLYLLNFAIIRIRKGDDAYRHEYVELIEIGRAQSLFIAAGYMPAELFTNIINFACLFQRLEWAKKIIKDWSIHLEPSVKTVTVNLSLARIYFEEKKFDKAITLIQEIPTYKNIAVNANARLLLIRAYFEQNLSENIQTNYCDSFYLYVHRSKSLGADLKKSLLNFIKIMRSLIKGKPKKQLVKELNSLEQPIICYDWLKAKIEERKR